MGSVYLARHAGVAGFHRLFAVKILHEHLAEKSSFVDMLRDEARVAARLHHPNVVPVVDLGTHDRDHYIVLDYVEGPSFSRLWRRSSGRLPREVVVSILIDTLDGLHAAHILKDDNGEELHLIHRDVSPSNILVGIEGIARITDFGIAKAKSRATSTQPGTLKGSLQYMSPEQIENHGSIDRRTDIWSVGVILWNVLTGERLFEADNDGATIEAILKREVRLPSMTEAGPPACFDDIVLRALERDPKKRYSSALEMGDALRKMAATNDMMGSRHQVAGWVENLFGDDLERRRAEIRKVVQRRSTTQVTNELSQVTVLPSLSSPPSGVRTDRSSISSFADEGHTGTTQTTVPAFWTYFWTARFQKKYLWVSLALLATLLTSSAMILYSRSTQSSITVTSLEAKETDEEKPAARPAVAQPEVSPVTAPTGQPSEPQLKSHQQSKSPLSTSRAPKRYVSRAGDNHREYQRTFRRVETDERSAAPAVVTARDASTPSDLEPEPVSASEAVPSAVPQTTPSSDYEFERNPYLMR